MKFHFNFLDVKSFSFFASLVVGFCVFFFSFLLHQPRRHRLRIVSMYPREKSINFPLFLRSPANFEWHSFGFYGLFSSPSSKSFSSCLTRSNRRNSASSSPSDMIFGCCSQSLFQGFAPSASARPPIRRDSRRRSHWKKLIKKQLILAAEEKMKWNEIKRREINKCQPSTSRKVLALRLMEEFSPSRYIVCWSSGATTVSHNQTSKRRSEGKTCLPSISVSLRLRLLYSFLRWKINVLKVCFFLLLFRFLALLFAIVDFG